MSGLFRDAIKSNPAAQKRVRNWVAALRSGEFVQGFNQLANTDGSYCCLGVACKLIEEPGRCDGNLHWRWCAAMMPGELADLYELADAEGGFMPERPEQTWSLASMNDCAQATFAEIADVIERELRLALGLEVSFARPLCAPLGTSW